MDWARILAYVTGTVEQELLARIEYLATTCCFSFTSRAAGWSLPGLPFTPYERWMEQIARNVTMEGALRDWRYLLRDRDCSLGIGTCTPSTPCNAASGWVASCVITIGRQREKGRLFRSTTPLRSLRAYSTHVIVPEQLVAVQILLTPFQGPDRCDTVCCLRLGGVARGARAAVAAGVCAYVAAFRQGLKETGYTAFLSSYNGVGPCCLVPVIVIHGGQYRDVGCSAPAAQALCRLLSARWPEARGRRELRRSGLGFRRLTGLPFASSQTIRSYSSFPRKSAMALPSSAARVPI